MNTANGNATKWPKTCKNGFKPKYIVHHIKFRNIISFSNNSTFSIEIKRIRGNFKVYFNLVRSLIGKDVGLRSNLKRGTILLMVIYLKLYVILSQMPTQISLESIPK